MTLGDTELIDIAIVLFTIAACALIIGALFFD